MLAVKPQSQAIGQFIDWLTEQGMEICKREDDARLWPVDETIEGLLARHFEIDLKKAEREKCALLDAIRAG